MVIAMTLENNKIYTTDELQFSLSCINSPTGACPCPCNYVTDSGCACRDVQGHLSISVTKSPVYVAYPLTYSRRYSGRTWESVIQTTNGNCVDSPNSLTPTCGWATQGGTNVLYSEGFCCGCTGGLQGGFTNYYRGNLNCNTGAWVMDLPASAHCLKMDDSWLYEGYTIGNYQLDFNINATATYSMQPPSPPLSPPATPSPPASPSSPVENEWETQELAVNPSSPLARDDAKTFTIKLLGDLSSYTQIPALQSNFLFVPLDTPTTTPTQAFGSNRDLWMIVEPSKVDPSGLTCNKIGVGYEAFRNNQANRCMVSAGSCLFNQIVDLYYEDVARYTAGQQVVYFAFKYGADPQNVRQVTFEAGPGGGSPQMMLNLPLTSVQQSLILLSVAADNVTFVENYSPASILNVEVCTINEGLCGGFQAMQGRGYAIVDVMNTGYLAASYYATITDCSDTIMSVPAQFSSIDARGNHTFVFELTSTSDQAADHNCTASVSGVLGSVLDSKVFSFYTNATAYSPPIEQASPSPNQGGAGVQSTPGSRSWCLDSCDSVFSLKCLGSNSCWSVVAEGAGYIAAIVAGALGLLYALKAGWILKLIILVAGACTCGAGSRSSRTKAPSSGADDSEVGQRPRRSLRKSFGGTPVHPAVEGKGYGDRGHDEGDERVGAYYSPPPPHAPPPVTYDRRYAEDPPPSPSYARRSVLVTMAHHARQSWFAARTKAAAASKEYASRVARWVDPRTGRAGRVGPELPRGAMVSSHPSMERPHSQGLGRGPETDRYANGYGRHSAAPEHRVSEHHRSPAHAVAHEAYREAEAQGYARPQTRHESPGRGSMDHERYERSPSPPPSSHHRPPPTTRLDLREDAPRELYGPRDRAPHYESRDRHEPPHSHRGGGGDRYQDTSPTQRYDEGGGGRSYLRQVEDDEREWGDRRGAVHPQGPAYEDRGRGRIRGEAQERLGRIRAIQDDPYED